MFSLELRSLSKEDGVSSAKGTMLLVISLGEMGERGSSTLPRFPDLLPWGFYL
jgi:hypothetical protein